MAANLPCEYGYHNRYAAGIWAAMPKNPCRPICPKCGMNMFGVPSGRKTIFECMRCGHVETHKEKE